MPPHPEEVDDRHRVTKIRARDRLKETKKLTVRERFDPSAARERTCRDLRIDAAVGEERRNVPERGLVRRKR
jgi:hypothetical protein